MYRSRGGFSGFRRPIAYNKFAPARGARIRAFDPSHLVGEAVEVVEEVFTPVHSFADWQLVEKLAANIVAHAYTQPTPIQDQAIGEILGGADVVGLANTGTGKTAAFLIPLIHRIMRGETGCVLIVAPTRELAVQIEDEFWKFATGTGVVATLCIGGESLRRQAQGLRRGPHVVIGTPGRLKDLEQQRILSFAAFDAIVLDEVDQMLDMGFIHDVTYMIDRLPQKRQSLFFSATMTPKVDEVMRRFSPNPVMISVKARDTIAAINQQVLKLAGRSRMDVLHELLRKEGFDKVLVFVRTKFATDRVARSLADKGISAAAIHGNKRMSQRRKALEEFKSERIQVLLATDMASRGLDIVNVTHVINYDLPETYEDYIHRIGRTGRANKTGNAITLVE